MRLNGSASLTSDQPVGIAVKYRGSSASATVEVTNGAITFKVGTAGAEAADTTVGASGVVDDATYVTLGAMVDIINASPNWRAELVDCLRADTSTNVLATLAAHTLSPVKSEVWPLYLDTSVKLDYAYRISARRLNWGMSQNGRVAVFKECRALVNVGSGTLTLNIYDVDQRSGTTVLLASFAGTDNTQLTANIAGGAGDLRSVPGHDLLVKYVMSVDCPDSGAYLNVSGYVY